ncbi:YchJ family protein [Fundidesulfovibrio agrisoli]|uniref:YchJ family protein n=1 Tax=Fundidesulfovibrio agrisoli TaxID=2922717 RepID=UPI0024351AEE|nr:YchJ family protein [Fundidesulfovibrio agrisoli]
MTKQLALDDPCPCCSGQPYGECCAPIVSGDLAAPTALALMRSRYTAYALGHIDYLKTSLDPRWQASFDEQSTREWSEKATWKGLEIIGCKEGGPDDEEGEVEFTATFEMDGEEQHLRERAKFRKRAGQWRYIDGRVKSAQEPVVSEGPKVGRNDPCPCGSGKKYKKCCG